MEIEKLFNGIYKNKTVLITGHSGFKGSWLALWLKKLGANVVGFSLYTPSVPAHFDLLELNITSVKGDIRNFNQINNVIKKHNPEIIFHLAAQPLVRYSYKEPRVTYETNILGTINIFESIRKNSFVKVFINVTTDKVYENKESEKGYEESDQLGGHDPYSTSKACSELISASYRRSFFNNQTLVASARAGNVIGGGDWAEDRLLPDIFRAADKKTKAKIRNPKSVRPWQHVLEPLSGYLQLGQKLLENKSSFADAWNFGPDEQEALPVKDVVKIIKERMKEIKFEEIKNSKDPHETTLLKLNCSKAKLKLKWQPVWNSEKAIQITTDWYNDFYQKKGPDMTARSLKDIHTYISAAKQKKLKWT